MDTTAPTPSARIVAAATAWPGVTLLGPGERGERSLVVGRREIGHLHGDHVAHFAFGLELGRCLRDEGRVGPHPITTKPTLAARRIAGEEDEREVLALLRLNDDRIVARHGLPSPAAGRTDLAA